MTRDHYTVLGVAATASPREISHAFHHLVRHHQTDHGDPDDLREVVAAYEVLRDPGRPRTGSGGRQHPPVRRGRPPSSGHTDR